jgi:hypothetical protein
MAVFIRHKALILTKNVLYNLNHEEKRRQSAPRLGSLIFRGSINSLWVRGRAIHA